MKKQELKITIVDRRGSPYDPEPPERRVKTYTSHKEYLRDMGRLGSLDAHIYEETETTVTLYPKKTMEGLFE